MNQKAAELFALAMFLRMKYEAIEIIFGQIQVHISFYTINNEQFVDQAVSREIDRILLDSGIEFEKSSEAYYCDRWIINNDHVGLLNSRRR